MRVTLRGMPAARRASCVCDRRVPSSASPLASVIATGAGRLDSEENVDLSLSMQIRTGKAEVSRPKLARFQKTMSYLMFASTMECPIRRQITWSGRSYDGRGKLVDRQLHWQINAPSCAVAILKADAPGECALLQDRSCAEASRARRERNGYSTIMTLEHSGAPAFRR
jgi:hypothetical protein